MTNLTKHETVWLQAYCAHSRDPELQVKQLTIYADAVLACFKDRFPPAPPPQKETVSGVEQVSCAHRLVRSDCVMCPPVEPAKLDGVYVTREMLAKAVANLRPNWSQTDRLLMVEQFSKELGLSE